MCDVATGCKAADKGMLQKFIERLIHWYFKVCQWFSVSKDISVSVHQFLFHKKWNKKKRRIWFKIFRMGGINLNLVKNTHMNISFCSFHSMLNV